MLRCAGVSRDQKAIFQIPKNFLALILERIYFQCLWASLAFVMICWWAGAKITIELQFKAWLILVKIVVTGRAFHSWDDDLDLDS